MDEKGRAVGQGMSLRLYEPFRRDEPKINTYAEADGAHYTKALECVLRAGRDQDAINSVNPRKPIRGQIVQIEPKHRDLVCG